MSDIHYAICNEPWDIYGLTHGDVKAWEADSIKKGYGCPCCKDNGYKPNKLYNEFEQHIHLRHCNDCNVNIIIDSEELYYDGSVKIFYHNSGTVHLDNQEEIERFLIIEHNWENINYELVCASCADNYSRCDICGGTFHEDETIFNQEDRTCCCEDCYSTTYGCCNECDRTTRYDELKDFDHNSYCEICYKEIVIECEICEEKFLAENKIEGINGEACCSEKCADKTTEEE